MYNIGCNGFRYTSTVRDPTCVPRLYGSMCAHYTTIHPLSMAALNVVCCFWAASLFASSRGSCSNKIPSCSKSISCGLPSGPTRASYGCLLSAFLGGLDPPADDESALRFSTRENSSETERCLKRQSTDPAASSTHGSATRSGLILHARTMAAARRARNWSGVPCKLSCRSDVSNCSDKCSRSSAD